MNLPTRVFNWASAQPNIVTAAKVSGGWERWGQMELTLTLKAVQGALADCETQVSDGSTQRCDIVYFDVPQQLHGAAPIHFIEMKCWNFRTETTTAFWTRFRNDCAKLYNYQAPPALAAHPIHKYSVGIVPLKAWCEHNNQPVMNVAAMTTWLANANNFPANNTVTINTPGGMQVTLGCTHRFTPDNGSGMALIIVEFVEIG